MKLFHIHYGRAPSSTFFYLSDFWFGWPNFLSALRISFEFLINRYPIWSTLQITIILKIGSQIFMFWNIKMILHNFAEDSIFWISITPYKPNRPTYQTRHLAEVLGFHLEISLPAFPKRDSIFNQLLPTIKTKTTRSAIPQKKYMCFSKTTNTFLLSWWVFPIFLLQHSTAAQFALFVPNFALDIFSLYVHFVVVIELEYIF